MQNFNPANNRGKDDYREIFLIEGDSAKGTAEQRRFPDTQAFFALRGVPLNCFGLKLDKILDNVEFKRLVIVLRCNVGSKFDINKLWYKKIIIMTDADIDGFRITSLLCTFFLVVMPEIIEQGYLYKAVTPLYKIKDKKRPFILNKQEYIEIFEERIRDNIKLIDPISNVVLSSYDMKELLMKNREYLEELNRVASHFTVDPNIIEFIVIHYDDEDFLKKFKKKFTELEIDNENVLSGIYEGKYQILIIDKIFFKRINTLYRLITEINNNKVYYKVHEVNSTGKLIDDRGIMSMGNFLKMCQKFQPEIEMRYKGLGELQPKELRETTLDPNNRILIQLTMNDIEKEIEKFNILHGDESEQRKKLMEHFKINREDLDN
jgi:DNA gyrase subunit B